MFYVVFVVFVVGSSDWGGGGDTSSSSYVSCQNSLRIVYLSRYFCVFCLLYVYRSTCTVWWFVLLFLSCFRVFQRLYMKQLFFFICFVPEFASYCVSFSLFLCVLFVLFVICISIYMYSMMICTIFSCLVFVFFRGYIWNNSSSSYVSCQNSLRLSRFIYYLCINLHVQYDDS
jgi:hypothetical protein